MAELTAVDDTPTESPALIDEAEFLSELDRLEVRGISRPAVAPAVTRDANRWHLHPPAGVAPEQPPERRAIAAWIFRDRVSTLIAVWWR